MEVSDEPFEFSAAPGRFATPLFGAAAIAALLAASALGRANEPWLALGTLVASALGLAIAGAWLARHGVMRLGLLRQRSINLVARRGEPAVWLVAHLDSKSQPVPMLLRAGGITLSVVIWLGALVLALTQALSGPDVVDAVSSGLAGWWSWIAGIGMIAGAPIVASFVGARSPGAVDNASGVATVLLAAQTLREAPIGVLLASGEELGLAGARAWVRTRPPGIAINCDGVDDDGTLTAMYSGRPPRRLLEVFARATVRTGVYARRHRLLPGMLVDGVALADAGWQVITLSRGTVQTLRRIHTPADDLGALTGAGVAKAASVMRRMVHELGEVE